MCKLYLLFLSYPPRPPRHAPPRPAPPPRPRPKPGVGCRHPEPEELEGHRHRAAGDRRRDRPGGPGRRHHHPGGPGPPGQGRQAHPGGRRRPGKVRAEEPQRVVDLRLVFLEGFFLGFHFLIFFNHLFLGLFFGG